MAHLLMSYYPSPLYYFHPQECLPSKIRLSIFLITEECVGLPAVVWALRVLYHHHKSGSRVSTFMITLLLSDLLVLLLNPYIVTKLLQDDLSWHQNMTCRVLSSFWSGSMIYGAHLQQVVALEGALSLRNLCCSAGALFPSCSLVISMILYVYFLLCEISEATAFMLFGLLLIFVIILMLWMLTCRAPPQISDTPSRDRRPSATVLAFVTVTGVLCVIFISMCTTNNFHIPHIPYIHCNLLIMCVCLMSLNVIIDPLLCVTVCRKHTKLNNSEVNV